jgi:hypothetical protein
MNVRVLLDGVQGKGCIESAEIEPSPLRDEMPPLPREIFLCLDPRPSATA